MRPSPKPGRFWKPSASGHDVIPPGRLFLLMASIAIIIGRGAALIRFLLGHNWLVDLAGRPWMTDFFGPWSAGKLAWVSPSDAYDWAKLAAFQHSIAHANPGFLPFPYPPIYLFVTAPIALLNYPSAFLAFVAITGTLYAATIIAITDREDSALLAFAVPAAYVNVQLGQNGLLTAAIIGGALLNLERRPYLAGIFLGFLTYKPQFGLLFPLVLIMGGHWRTIASATVTAGFSAAAAGLVFGWDTYLGFFHGLALSSDHGLGLGLNRGMAGWLRIQSFYGLARALGGGNAIAWEAQAVGSTAATLTVLWLWRQDIPHPLKAAALSAGVLLATPFVFLYDYAILTVAMAFLYRDQAFDTSEWAALIIGNVLIYVLAQTPALPLAPLVPLMILAIISRRLRIMVLEPA